MVNGEIKKRIEKIIILSFDDIIDASLQRHYNNLKNSITFDIYKSEDKPREIHQQTPTWAGR